MTLLNTFTNLGGTWPKFFVLKGIDFFTIATCDVPEGKLGGGQLTMAAPDCVSDEGKASCTELGGTCHIGRDGYYPVSAICIGFAVIFLVAYIIPTARRLQGKFSVAQSYALVLTSSCSSTCHQMARHVTIALESCRDYNLNGTCIEHIAG